MQTIKPERIVDAQTVAEYNSARQEMMERIKLRDQYIGIQIGAIATAFGAAQQATQPGGIPWFLLAVPLISFVGLSLNRSHTVVIEHIVGYLRSNFPTGYDASDYWEFLKLVGREEPITDKSYVFAVRQRKNVLPRVSNGANVVAILAFFIIAFCNSVPSLSWITSNPQAWDLSSLGRIWKSDQPPLYVPAAFILALMCAFWAWSITHEMKVSGKYISAVQSRHTLSGVRSKSRVAIIGASGYIGRVLVPYLVARGYEVMAIDRRVTVTESFQNGVIWLRLDASDANELHRFLSLYRPDTIVNLAGYAPHKITVDHRYGDELRLVTEAIKASAEKIPQIEGVVHISSALVYGDTAEESCEGDVDITPTSNATKPKARHRPTEPVKCQDVYRSCENTIGSVKSTRCGVTVLRLFNVAGHASGHEVGSDHYPETHLIPLCVASALGRYNRFKLTDASQSRDYVHVLDVCSAIHLAIDDIARTGMKELKCFNVCTGTCTTNQEVLDKVQQLTGLTPKQNATIKIEQRGWDTATRVGKNTNIATHLGWKAARNLDDIVSSEVRRQRYLMSSP